MARLVDDLLDLSRIESRQFKLNIEAVEVSGAIDRVFGQFRARAEARRISLSGGAAAGGVFAKADRRALEQVLANLVENAVKYCTEGATVTVAAVASGDKVRVTITDTGPGIE
jgi:two-component system phosphate regulon sensor histidine kinase PhoR